MDKSLIFFGFVVSEKRRMITLKQASLYINAIISDITNVAETKIDQTPTKDYGQICPIGFDLHKESGTKEVVVLGTFAFVCNDIESFRKMKLMVSERRAKEIKEEAGIFDLVYHTEINPAHIPNKNNHIVRIRYDSSLKINDKDFNTFYNTKKKKSGVSFIEVL